MKLFHSESEKDHVELEQAVSEQFEYLEETVEALRHRVSQRRTLLKNAEKKLQEFQDSIYAMLIEESAPKKPASPQEDADDPEAFDSEENNDLLDLLGDHEEEEA